MQNFGVDFMQKYNMNLEKIIYSGKLDKKRACELEKNIYKTTNEYTKVEFELNRLLNFFDQNIQEFYKYSFDFNEIKDKYKISKLEDDDFLLEDIKKELVALEIKCNMNIGLLTTYVDIILDEENKNYIRHR